jgi:Mg2+ and Co2+ transporter CorA
MNKISESIIVTYAKALRRIQTEQVDPYIELIEKELIKLYPELKDREDNALNWAYDILNADSTAEVVETLTRVEKIITNERKEKWLCGYCGKNTYNDDSEYLFGTNHIGCVLEEDIKNREHSDPDYILDARLRKVSEIEEKLNHYESELDKLQSELRRLSRGYPHEPTN